MKNIKSVALCTERKQRRRGEGEGEGQRGGRGRRERELLAYSTVGAEGKYYISANKTESK